MKKSQTIVEDMALADLAAKRTNFIQKASHADWIRIIRNHLRMTQTELAMRARVSQPHLAAIESGRIDPQVSTLKRIYEGLGCDLILEPRPRKPLDEALRGRARSVALRRLKQAMGNMALENQAPGKDVFLKLLEKRTDEILRDPRERLSPVNDE